MKIFKRLIVIALSVVFFGGCQKELNFDGEPAHGSLKSAITGDCNPITVNGFYQEDSTLNADNWVEVQVNTNFAGNFDIRSDTVNGFSFYRVGYLPLGLSTVRLPATGKPDTAINTTFTIRFDTSFCTFTINVLASTVGIAHYVLGGSPGACATFTPHGTYAVGTPLDASDSVTFLVNVTTPGTYNISTATVNGMKFSGVGSFPNLGITQVTLYGSGTPTSNATANFSPTGDGTTCTFSITPGGGAGSASFTFDGGPAPGTCSGAILNGTYTVGTAMNANNYVDLAVTVTAVGTYGITTTANGITFSKTGTFTSTTPSPQTVRLQASGTPTNSGSFNFTPTGTPGSSSCVFSVTFTGGAPINPDYIPQTVGSSWTDSLKGGTAADTSNITVSSNTKSVGGNTYQVFQMLDTGTPIDSFYHRKALGKYYEYYYSDFGIFDNPLNTDVLLLDSTLSAGGTWTVTFPPNSIFGTPVNFKIDASILAKGATATPVSTTYNNVIKVLFIYKADIGAGYMEQAREEFWYAKGFGLIYDKQTDTQGGGTVTEYLTKRIQIF